jgi:hypothetical protein
MPTRSPKGLIIAGAVIIVLSIVDAFAVHFYLNNTMLGAVSCLAGISIGTKVIGKGYSRLKSEEK